MSIFLRSGTHRIFGTVAKACCALVFAMPAALQAQESLEEIVVTAQQREQSLQDVPISIEVVTGEVILQQGYEDLTMLQNFTPNLDIRTSIDQPSTKIRGVGTVGDNFGFEQSVPMFVDGDHYGRGTQITNSFLDIERVEVLRGPQPVYFGQNAVAGAISLVTRGPTPEWEGYANASYGSNDTVNVELAGGGPLSETVGIRAAAKYESSGGYLKSVWHGGEFPESETSTARLKLEWRPSEKATISAKLDYLDLQRGGLGSGFILTDGSLDCLRDYGLCVLEDPAAFGIELAQTPPTRNFNDVGTGTGPPFESIPNYQDTGIVIAGRGGGNNGRPTVNIVPLMMNPPADLDLRRSNLDWNAFEDVESYAVALKFEYDFANDIQLVARTTFIDHDRTARDNQPADNGPFPIRKTDKWELVEQWNYELRLASPTGGFFEWMVGAYMQDQKMDLNQISVRAVIRNGAYEEGLSFQDSLWKSAFASVTFNFSETLALDVGVRHTQVEKDGGISPFRSAGWICDDGLGGTRICVDDDNLDAGAVPVGLAPILPRFDPFEQSYDTSDTNEQIALRWRPTDSVSAYVKYANSFKAGGFDFGKTLFTPSIIDRFQFKDEFVDSYEIGVKGEMLDGRGSYEVIAFTSEFTDMQLSAFDTVLEVQRASNVAKQRARGVELRGQVLLTDRWDLSLTAAFLDGEMISFPGATCTEEEIDQNKCLDQDGNPDPGGTIDRSGQEPPRSPDWQYVVNTSYWVPVGSDNKIVLNAQGSYSDGYTINTGFDKIVAMDVHGDLNVSVGYGPQDDTWKLSVYGRNLTEPTPKYFAKYDLAPDGFALTESTNRSMFATYGVQFRYNF
jgi:iron complex outermembrane receptor protein